MPGDQISAQLEAAGARIHQESNSQMSDRVSQHAALYEDLKRKQNYSLKKNLDLGMTSI